MKRDWKKDEKELYVPGKNPIRISVPSMQFLVLEGRGDPNHSKTFSAHVEALFGLCYGLKFAWKKAARPGLPEDYTVYPLEGVWDIAPEARERKWTKADLVYRLMIRQPDFLPQDFLETSFPEIRTKKGTAAAMTARWETISDGACVQMMHIGPYDDEPASFARMEAWMAEQGLERKDKTHREIYLSDFRRTAPEKLKTVLRVFIHG